MARLAARACDRTGGAAGGRTRLPSDDRRQRLCSPRPRDRRRSRCRSRAAFEGGRSRRGVRLDEVARQQNRSRPWPSSLAAESRTAAADPSTAGARRRRDQEAVHLRRFSRGGRVRQRWCRRRGRRPSSRHPHQLQARHADLLDAQRRRADREGLRRRRHGRPRRLMRLKRTYSSREVAALTGLSARQLQIWDAGGLLSPAIPSHRTAAGGYTERRYTPIELFELLVLADLRRRGFTVPQLHAIVDALEAQFRRALFEAPAAAAGAAADRRPRRSTRGRRRGEFYNLLESPGAAAAGGRRTKAAEGAGRRGGSGSSTAERRLSGSGRSSRGRRPAAG